jgi:MFS family permease
VSPGPGRLAAQPISWQFWVLTGLLCLASATQDLAVDAYTIDILETEELGLANGVRNGAYRVGALTAGSGLLILSDWVGWQPAFVGIGVVMAAMVVTILAFKPFRLPRAGAVQDNPRPAKGLSQIVEAARGLRLCPLSGPLSFSP